MDKDQIIIRPVTKVRDGWDAAFKKMAQKGDDELIFDEITDHSWDDEEWQW